METSGVAYVIELLSPLSMPPDNHNATRLAPCADPILLAEVAVLLALLTTVHDGRRRPAHTLAHHRVSSPRRLPRTVLIAPSDATRLAPCETPALLADVAVLLALLVTVHNGLRRPAHALAPRPVRLLVAVNDGRRRPAHARKPERRSFTHIKSHDLLLSVRFFPEPFGELKTTQCGG
jgi:hypothetical protein